MTRYAILTDPQGLKYVSQTEDGPYDSRTEAEQELLDTVRRQDMTPEAWRSLQHLLES